MWVDGLCRLERGTLGLSNLHCLPRTTTVLWLAKTISRWALFCVCGGMNVNVTPCCGLCLTCITTDQIYIPRCMAVPADKLCPQNICSADRKRTLISGTDTSATYSQTHRLLLTVRWCGWMVSSTQPWPKDVIIPTVLNPWSHAYLFEDHRPGYDPWVQCPIGRGLWSDVEIKNFVTVWRYMEAVTWYIISESTKLGNFMKLSYDWKNSK
jgi:hypothetical protein